MVRLTRWREALVRARQYPLNAGILDATGPLFADVDGRAEAIPPGRYMCRIAKLMVPALATDGIVENGRPWLEDGGICDVAATRYGNQVSIAFSWPQLRIDGAIYADGNRLIVLGARAFPSDVGHFHYGDDILRDVAGQAMAIAPGRWRVLLPPAATGDRAYFGIELIAG